MSFVKVPKSTFKFFVHLAYCSKHGINDIISLVYKADQKAVKVTPDGKGVRFDVYFEDDQNVIYDLEMQTFLKANL